MKLLSILAAVVASLPVAASAQDLAVHTGMPIVVSFLGQTRSDGVVDRKHNADLGIDFTVDLDDVFQLGGTIGGVYADGAYRDVEGLIYSVTAGPTALLTTEKWTGRNMVFGFSVTPGVLVLGASDKQGSSRASVTFGGLAKASIRFRLTQSFSLGVFGSFGYYAPPGNNQWLGNELGSTMLAAIDLGIVWHF